MWIPALIFGQGCSVCCCVCEALGCSFYVITESCQCQVFYLGESSMLSSFVIWRKCSWQLTEMFVRESKFHSSLLRAQELMVRPWPPPRLTTKDLGAQILTIRWFWLTLSYSPIPALLWFMRLQSSHFAWSWEEFHATRWSYDNTQIVDWITLCLS